MWRLLLNYLASLINFKKEPVPTPAPSPVVPTPKPIIPEPVVPLTVEEILLNEHNAYRIKNELNPLVMNKELCAAALEHANWMSASNRMSHIGKGGSTHSQRARKNGYIGLVAENIAMCGFCNELDVVKMWVNSRGHRENILGNFQDIGLARSGDYWCVVFGVR